jgi:conjugal transfer pilus assembly protein TraW
MHDISTRCATLALILAVAATLYSPAYAGTATIGRTWSIVEPDAMAEIEARTARQPVDMAGNFGPRAGWSAMQAASLGIAAHARTRSVVPFYTLDFDIKLPDGTMLYPKGYTFNPLTYVSLPQRLVIVHPRDLGWALRTARPADFILLTAGDALALGENVGRPLFILEERVKDRLGLTVAPVIVAQTGQRLLLQEIVPPKGQRGGAQ